MNTIQKDYKKVTEKGTNVIYVSAAWCGPCKVFSPIVEEASKSFSTIWKADADENTELCEEYNIRSIPTLLFFKDGELVKTKTGSLPKVKLEEELKY